jgi:hypothetical protein
MPLPAQLPRTLYAELGKLSVIWANIEQDMILQTSAMCAQDTDGRPIEYLRMDFKRLREKWYKECRKRFDAETFNKIVHPLNTKLAALSPERGHAIHGLWNAKKRGKYELLFFEQKQQLASYRMDYSLKQLRGLVSASNLACKELYSFTTGAQPRMKNKLGPFAELK